MRAFLMFEVIEKLSSRNTWEAVGHVGLEFKTKKEVKKEIFEDFSMEEIAEVLRTYGI